MTNLLYSIEFIDNFKLDTAIFSICISVRFLVYILIKFKITSPGGAQFLGLPLLGPKFPMYSGP